MAIGVILMMAIAVLLAALTGTFFLDLGGGTHAASAASLSVHDAKAGFAADGPTQSVVVIRHDSGDGLEPVDLRIVARLTVAETVAGEWHADGDRTVSSGGDTVTAVLDGTELS